MIQIVLFVTFACNTNGNPSLYLVAIIITLIVLLLLCWSSRRVYKNHLLGIIESFFFVNLAILSSFTLFLNSALPESEDRSLVIVNISVGLVAVICRLLHHIVLPLSPAPQNDICSNQNYISSEKELSSINSTKFTATQWKL